MHILTLSNHIGLVMVTVLREAAPAVTKYSREVNFVLVLAISVLQGLFEMGVEEEVSAPCTHGTNKIGQQSTIQAFDTIQFEDVPELTHQGGRRIEGNEVRTLLLGCHLKTRFQKIKWMKAEGGGASCNDASNQFIPWIPSCSHLMENAKSCERKKRYRNRLPG